MDILFYFTQVQHSKNKRLGSKSTLLVGHVAETQAFQARLYPSWPWHDLCSLGMKDTPEPKVSRILEDWAHSSERFAPLDKHISESAKNQEDYLLINYLFWLFLSKNIHQ